MERLVFYNHTECECRDKHEEMMPRDQSQVGDNRGSITSRSSALSSTINLVKVDDRDKKKSLWVSNNLNLSNYNHIMSYHSYNTNKNHIMYLSTAIVKEDTWILNHDFNLIFSWMNRCKCPSVFSRRPLPDNVCVCDCFDKQTDCLHLKHGMEFFSVSDKWYTISKIDTSSFHVFTTF